jgi:hypothetical protein
LDVMFPGAFGQLSESAQFRELGFIVRIVDGAGAETIAQAKGDVVGLHDFANLIEIRIKKILLMMCEAPFREN